MGGWSPAFLAMLERERYQLGFRLQSWVTVEAPDGFRFAGIDPIATTSDDGAEPIIVSVETTGDELDPFDASRSTLGEWAVTLAIRAYADLGPLAPGSLVELIVYDVVSTLLAERVLFGVVHNLERVTDAIYRIRVRSPIFLLGSRYTVAAEELAVANDLATTVRNEVIGWTAGDPSLLVDDVTGFRRETGMDGVVRVTPDASNPAGTDAFYVRWDGITGSAFDLPTGLGVLGTTALDLSGTGYTHDVKEVLFVEDHPARAALKMFVSTGTGGNGSYDTLPDSWGWGIPAQYVDPEDTEYWIAQSSPATGTDAWQIWTADKLDNPGDWLVTLLASGGWWITMRQGRLTVRALVPVADRPDVADVTITDDDLIAWEEIEAFDAASEVGAKTLRVAGPTTTGSYSEEVTRLPATRYADLTVSEYAHANEAEWVASIAERVGPWILRQHERRVGRFRGLRLAQLAPGSAVRVILSGDGRLAPYTDRAALITQVSPDWSAGTVRIALVIQPAEGEL